MADIVNDIDFQRQAENILEQLQKIVEQQDNQIIIDKLKPICQRFSVVYDYFYQHDISYNEALQQYGKFLKHLTVLSQSSDESSNVIQDLNNIHKIQNLSQFNNQRYGLIQQLQIILTGFKSIFLRLIGQEFVQVVVVEVEDEHGNLIPQTYQMQNWMDLASIIVDRTDGLQGRLMQNKKMAQHFEKRQHNTIFEKIASNHIEKCNAIYSQAKRRINIFYTVTGHTGGQSLLLYKLSNRWFKFWVANLGDLKEGYVTMVMKHQGEIPTEQERQIQLFTRYIGQVDNIAGTLLQDVQTQQNQQISVKSSRAQTGSHMEIIALIKEIANSNDSPLNLINKAFQKDKVASLTGKGRRNRLLDSKKDKEKLAKLLKKNGANKARTITNQIIPKEIRG